MLRISSGKHCSFIPPFIHSTNITRALLLSNSCTENHSIYREKTTLQLEERNQSGKEETSFDEYFKFLRDHFDMGTNLSA